MAQKILTNPIIKAFQKQGDTSNKESKDIKVICKLFNPTGAGTWWLFEQIEEDIFMCFAELGDPMCAEIGTVSLSELMSIKLRFGLHIERDSSYEIGQQTVQEVIDEVKGKA